VLHLRHDIFKHRVRHITDEQVTLRVLVRKELVGWLHGAIRGFRNHGPYSWYQEPVSNFRGIRNQRSVVDNPLGAFVVSGTQIRISGTEFRGFKNQVSWF
jgi:hypothetical protein